MRREFLIKSIVFLLFLVSFVSVAQHHGQTGHEVSPVTAANAKTSLKKQIKDYINHHLLDSHDFGLYSSEDEAGNVTHVGFPLPVILWDQEAGLTIFSSESTSRTKMLSSLSHLLSPLLCIEWYAVNVNAFGLRPPNQGSVKEKL